MKTKYINNDTKVDLDESRCVWDNDKLGDARVELWTNNVHVWAETNGDPVYGEESLRELLIDEGMDDVTADRVIVGDLDVLNN